VKKNHLIVVNIFKGKEEAVEPSKEGLVLLHARWMIGVTRRK
jgi:hypothetical protein